MKSHSIWIYPWDIADEGIDRVLDRLQANGLNGINVAVSYHSGFFLLPRNPSRKLIFPEPGAIYIEPGRWYASSPIQPPVSAIVDRKFWSKLREATRKRGMKLTAWTLLLHNSALGFRYPETAAVNAFGDRLPTALCPSNAQLRRYFLDFYTDLAQNYEFDAILLESLECMPLRHGYHHEVMGVPMTKAIEFLLSLSFNPGMTAAAEAKGIDAANLARFVRDACCGHFADPFQQTYDWNWDELLTHAPSDFLQYLQLREQLLLDLLTEIRRTIGANAPGTELHAVDFGPLYGLGPRGTSWENGVDLAKWTPVVDAFHPTFYFTDAAVLEKKIAEYRSLLAQCGAIPAVIPAIRAILPQTAGEQDLLGQVRALSPISQGFSFYNYGFMADQTLAWIGNAIRSKDA